MDKDGNPYSGNFKASPETGKHVIELALNAPWSTGFHEAMHSLFTTLANEPATAPLRRALLNAARSPHVVKQLNALAEGNPGMQEQIKEGARGWEEERISYMAEMYLAGKLTLDAKPANIVQKIAAMIRKAAGLISDEMTSKEIMDALARGDFADPRNVSAVTRSIMEKGAGKPWLRTVAKAGEVVVQSAKAVTFTATGRLMDTGIPALEQLAAAFQRDLETGETTGGGKLGYLQAVERTTNQLLNKYAAAVEGLDEYNEARILKALQSQDYSELSEADRAIAARVREVLEHVFKVSAERGAPLKHAGPLYFPRVWDHEIIAGDTSGFAELLTRHGVAEDVAHQIAADLAHGSTPVDSDLNGVYFASEHMLKLPRTQKFYADAQRFMNQNLNHIMISYLRGAARRIEYTDVFGAGGERIKSALAKAERQGATKEELDMARDAVRDMQGTRRHTSNPTLENINQWGMTAANVLFMPLGLLASLQDPVGLAIRTGRMGDAGKGYANAFRDIKADVTGKRSDEQKKREQLAEDFGVNAHQSLADLNHAMYDAHGFTGMPKKINDYVFKMNMMEGLTRSLRATATEHAIKFIEENINTPGKHSERFLNELGLTPARRKALEWKDGKLVRDARNGVLSGAVHRYVDSVVQRPTVAERPLWANDPRFAALWQYKQFAYTFERQITSRVFGEVLDHKNYAPMVVAAAFIPAALAGLYMKSWLAGGFELSPRMSQMGPLDALMSGSERVFGGPGALWGGVADDPQFGAGPVVNTVARALGIESSYDDGGISGLAGQVISHGAPWLNRLNRG